MLFYWLVRNMTIINTQLIALATPVVAVLAGCLVLDEELTWRIALGGAGIFAGIGLVIYRRRNPTRELQETPEGLNRE